MQKELVAIVVGGVVNHRILIKKLKDRGYYTILVDYLPNPPAKDIADEHVQISTFDIDAIRRLAIERNCSLIINACVDQVNVGIMKVAEDLGLPHPYSYETALAIADKQQMKSIMVKGGVLTTPFLCVTSPEEVNQIQLKYPLFVKPSDGYGSNGVSKVWNEEEAKAAVKKAISVSRTGKVIVEEEAKGFEHSVYCFPQDGKANVLLIARKYTDNESSDGVVKSFGTIAPAQLSQEALRKINETADRLVVAFGLDNVPMFLQVMVRGDEVNVIEFSARMAGGTSCRTIKIATGFDLFDATINAFLRVKNSIQYHYPDQLISISVIYAEPCIFDHLSGYEQLLATGRIREMNIARTTGAEIKRGSANGSRIGFIIHTDAAMSGLMDKIDETFQKLRVIDKEGNDRLVRRLHLTEELIITQQ